MELVGGILKYNLIGWMEIISCVAILYGIYQCEIREYRRYHRITFLTTQLLLFLGTALNQYISIKETYWSEVSIIGLITVLLIFKEKWSKLVIIYVMSKVTQYYLVELILLSEGFIFREQILKNEVLEAKIIVFLFSTGIAWGILLLMNRRPKLQKKIAEITGLYYAIFVINGISCFFILYNVIKIYENDKENVLGPVDVFTSIVFCLLLIIGGFILIFVDKSRKYYQKQNYLIKQYIDIQKEYYNTTYQADQNVRTIRTGLTENLKELRGLIEEEKLDETIQFIGQITNDMNRIKTNSLRTNRPMVDALLNKLAKEAEKDKVKLNLKGIFGDVLLIEDYDLCSMLYACVERGIEACKKFQNEKNRIISIEIGRFKNCLDLKITNAVHEDSFIEENKIEINKDNVKNYGFGIENIKDMAEKYDGLIDFYLYENSFLVEVVFLEAYQ